MSWQRSARNAWDDHQRLEVEATAARAAGTREYLLRQVERLHLRPTAGTARLGEDSRITITTEWVGYRLPVDSDATRTDAWELRCPVTDGVRPVMHAWVLPWGDTQWIDRGVVETQADLGRALDPRANAPAVAAPEREQTEGDMLLSVLRAIVTEVVHDVIDGRLGSGPP